MTCVLVVEDDPDIRAAMDLVLTTEGYQVQTCCNGEEAIAQLDFGIRPRAILLDLMMPVMNGFDMLIALRQNPEWARIPVVVVSGNRGYGADDLNVHAIVRKPFEVQDLVQALGSAPQAA